MKKFWLAVPIAIGALAWVPFVWLAPQPTASAAPHVVVSQVEEFTPLNRPNYRYSLIPYGVQFPEQLQTAVARDQDLAEHFKDFDFSKAHFTVLDKDTCAYVSFRKENNVRWTSRCVMLHKGELILTDGRIMIRARCGNRISYIPQAPVDPIPIDDLDRAELPPSDYPRVVSGFAFENVPPLPPSVPPTVPPATTTNYPPISPVIPVGTANPISGVGCCATTPAKPVAVPEADSYIMLAMCILLLAAATYHRKTSRRISR
ncbi:MAG TPA: hypothetical protein VFA74_09410 [Terriglobales bacterium]|nr:hypothetical protein [Terriglobales bacterium]